MHEIPPAVTNGLFTLAAAAVSGVLGAVSGKHKGRIEGEEKVHADYINAIEGAAATVIQRLQHLVASTEAREAVCLAELAHVKEKQATFDAQQAALRAQIEALMSGPVALYRQDGPG